MRSRVKNKLLTNSVFMFFKLFVNILASFYISRELLHELGIEGFGIYNVVAGVVLTLTFMSSAMSSAITRFYNYYLEGEAVNKTVSQIFSISLIALVSISFCVMLVGCLSADFIIYDFLNIPDDRKTSALIVFFATIAVLAINLLNIPFVSLIMANEDMRSYAIIGFFEIALKLIFVTALSYLNYDILEVYSYFVLAYTSIISITYIVFCRLNYRFVSFEISFDFQLIKELLGFIGWNIFGSLSVMMRDHGVNILLNMFFGPQVNATRAIALQVNNAVGSLASQLSIVTTPRITKNISVGDYSSALQYVYMTSKFCCVIVVIASFCIYTSLNEVLSLWLNENPPYIKLFINLMLVNLIVDSLSYPLISFMLAFGNIRNYQLIVSSVTFLNLPISWLSLSSGMAPESTIIVSISLAIVALYVRLYLLRAKVDFSFRQYGVKVIVPIITFLLCLYLANLVIEPILASIIASEFLKLGITLCVSLVTSMISSYFIILSLREKTLVKLFLKKNLITLN